MNLEIVKEQVEILKAQIRLLEKQYLLQKGPLEAQLKHGLEVLAKLEAETRGGV